MPANRKNALIGKQNRLIATRLLQISLLVDDYVYQHKPMSPRSAATYIGEISAYKDKCYRDVRSLQVIEKLTRCMNEIILEQQELNGEYVEDNRVVPLQEISQDNEPMLSPVYSNPDEDLTQMPVEIHDRGTDLNNKDQIETRQVTIEKVNNNMMEDIGTDFNNTVRYFNDEAKVTSTEHPLNNEMEIIDLSDDVVDLINPGDDIFHHEPELNIHNAVSNLSLKATTHSAGGRAAGQAAGQAAVHPAAYNAAGFAAQRSSYIAAHSRSA